MYLQVTSHALNLRIVFIHVCGVTCDENHLPFSVRGCLFLSTVRSKVVGLDYLDVRDALEYSSLLAAVAYPFTRNGPGEFTDRSEQRAFLRLSVGAKIATDDYLPSSSSNVCCTKYNRLSDDGGQPACG